jgi:hypothetical protein
MLIAFAPLRIAMLGELGFTISDSGTTMSVVFGLSILVAICYLPSLEELVWEEVLALEGEGRVPLATSGTRVMPPKRAANSGVTLTVRSVPLILYRECDILTYYFTISV